MNNNLSYLDKMYFWSDPHFGHKHIIQYSKRPYETIEEMNEDFIARYNATIPKDGTCIWVGDCFFLGKDRSAKIMSQLNGKKILVRGNHDNKHAFMYSIGFDFVCDYMEIIIGGKMVRIKHFPPKKPKKPWQNRLLDRIKQLIKPVKTYSPRYIDQYPEQNGQWTIHGHTHGTERVNKESKAIHVGVDAWNYTPVSYRVIETIVNSDGSVNVEEKRKK